MVCAGALTACAPEYSEYSDYRPRAASSAAAAAAKKSQRPEIPLPDRALLTPQPAPDCDSAPPQTAEAAPRRLANNSAAQSQNPAGASDATGSGAAATPDAAVQSDPNAELALRIKIEYERECYRRAEVQVRDRLQKLQASTSETIKSVNRLAP